MDRRSVVAKIKLLRSIVSVVVRHFRSRAILELENLALSNQTAGFASSAARLAPAACDRPRALGLALPNMAALSGHDGAGQASHCRPMARPESAQTDRSKE